MDDSIEMAPLWSSGVALVSVHKHQPWMQVHNYQHFGRSFSVNDPDAHSLALDYMHCHLIDDDYVVGCDAARSVISIWIDVLDDGAVARIGSIDALAAAAADGGDGGGGDDDAIVVVSLH